MLANIAVFVSGGGTNLQALIDSEKEKKLKSGNIKLVVSNKEDAYALKRAENENIKTEVVLKKNFDTQKDFEEKLYSLMIENNIDLIVLAGFMSILTKNFTSRFEKRIINVHPSLIPSFCGKGFYGIHVHEAALKYGVKISGATVHFVNEIPDGGEIIYQKAVKILKNDTPQSLQKRIMQQAEWKILPKAVEKVCSKISKSKNREAANERL